ncbi:hypothetical protein MJ923_12095 [Shewanella sp. 3B26]|uniref:Uncharacterized protein n=1 Tax=Shewanella zhuhaiensis TaxID=2919576 RepID=A0AAJ1F0X0_9GAMM|nr:hypothetical protein [Shewanella zhuhaiensis]MCH4295042.1 hypothetical protein [Shewanella zhuhaiensis]
MEEQIFTKLIGFLSRVPAIHGAIGKGLDEHGHWWVKFRIETHHEYAWHTVQELGHILNYLTLNERLPTSFKPISPPPYMNGGPEEFLSWVIESNDSDFTPDICAKWLEGRLPNPVEDLEQWADN